MSHTDEPNSWSVLLPRSPSHLFVLNTIALACIQFSFALPLLVTALFCFICGRKSRKRYLLPSRIPRGSGRRQRLTQRSRTGPVPKNPKLKWVPQKSIPILGNSFRVGGNAKRPANQKHKINLSHSKLLLNLWLESNPYCNVFLLLENCGTTQGEFRSLCVCFRISHVGT